MDIGEIVALVNRMREYEKSVKDPNARKCRIEWVSLTGDTGHGNWFPLDDIRAFCDKPNLQIGDTWTDKLGWTHTLVGMEEVVDNN